MEANPSADVVVIVHAGLERYPTFSELARHVPLHTPIRVTAWRVPRSSIPYSAEAQIPWLDGLWCKVDDWISQEIEGSEP